MRRVPVGRKTIVALCAGLGVFLSLSSMVTPADARVRHRRHVARAVPSYSPPFAAMVVDGNTGKTLYAKNENELRHPASITKVMTLYMLFEQLERGKLTLDSEIDVSAHAASMAPTKLGLRAGSTITVENAIRAIVTKSANDMAVAVAEAIGGSEDHFAEMMTAKAHALGMTRTNLVNASGLPDDDQVTTAKDLVTLGRVIQERFPKYYGFFSIHDFRFGRAYMRNHNNLLGRVEGMDGIKTGYTRASGFNLLTSVKRGNRRIVAVVLGGRSAGVRDNIMAGLIEEQIQVASTNRTAGPVVAERDVEEAPKPRPMVTTRWEAPVVKPEPKPEPVPVVAPGKPMQLASVAPAAPQPEKIRPAVVSGSKPGEDAAVTPGTINPSKRVVLDGSTASRPVAASMTGGATPSGASNLRWVSGPNGAPAKPPVAKPELAVPVKHPAETKVAKAEPAKPEASRPAAARRGVMIQIGATDDAQKANELLARARTQGKGALGSAQGFTEKVQKGSGTLYRARFAGLEEEQAEAACKSLKRSGFACFTTKN